MVLVVLQESPDITSPKRIIFLSPFYCKIQVYRHQAYADL